MSDMLQSDDERLHEGFEIVITDDEVTEQEPVRNPEHEKPPSDET